MICSFFSRRCCRFDTLFSFSLRREIRSDFERSSRALFMRLIYAKPLYIAIIKRVFTKKKACFLSLITKLLPAGLHLDSFDHHHQLGTVNHTATLSQRERGDGAIHQAFVVQHITSSLTVK